MSVVLLLLLLLIHSCSVRRLCSVVGGCGKWGRCGGNHCTVRNCEKWEMWLSIRDNVAVELFERRVKDGGADVGGSR